MSKKIKIVETGYDNSPCVIVGKVDKNIIEFRGTVFGDYKYLKLTKGQARRLGKWLMENSNGK